MLERHKPGSHGPDITTAGITALQGSLRPHDIVCFGFHLLINKGNMRNTFLLLLLLHAIVIATGMSGSYSGDDVDVISDITSKRARQPCSTPCEVAVGGNGTWTSII